MKQRSFRRLALAAAVSMPLAIAGCASAPAGLWPTAEREFPEWFAAQKPKPERERLVALRDLKREQAKFALAASPERQQRLVEAFAGTLGTLRKAGTEQCFAFLSEGEAGDLPAATLEPYLVAALEAIAEGRRAPRTHAKPEPADYAALSAALKDRGWSGPDFEIYSNAEALMAQPREKACQLVHEFYASLLDVRDPAARGRLIADSLAAIVSD